MVATEDSPSAAPPPLDLNEARAALGRGEVVRLLAAVETGRITPEQFLALLDEDERRHWWRRVILAILGR